MVWLIFGPTKTDKARLVGMPKFLIGLLSEHLAALDGGPDALVFRSPDGGPLRHHNMYLRAFKPAVRAALSPEKHGLRFHDLRHTCASLLIAAGAHPKAIQEHLGHKNIQTTFNVYGHLLPSAHEALAAALDATFESAQAMPERVAHIDSIRSLEFTLPAGGPVIRPLLSAWLSAATNSGIASADPSPALSSR